MTTGRPLIAVIDYGIGNLRSAQKALERVGADARLTANEAIIRDAAGVVLPGVGAFASTDTPFLGICIGMQLLYEESEENPGRPGLAVLPGIVRRLPEGVKHPQMQWNTIALRNGSSLYAGLSTPAWFYFVHSFAPDDLANATATCDYGGTVVAAVERGSVAAMQFHPEKSAANGLHVLGNFVARCAG